MVGIFLGLVVLLTGYRHVIQWWEASRPLVLRSQLPQWLQAVRDALF
jgi:hypothetical protein